MKTAIPLLTIPLLALCLVGCGSHSDNNGAGSTNSTASQPAGSPGNENNPTVGMTNSAVPTNNMDTNLPAETNK